MTEADTGEGWISIISKDGGINTNSAAAGKEGA
jgi:hypothetical protein